jgi:hypothetical protein
MLYTALRAFLSLFSYTKDVNNIINNHTIIQIAVTSKFKINIYTI